MTRTVKIGEIAMGGGRPFVLIAGPCVIETESMALKVAEETKRIADGLSIPFIYKSSYDKANRTSVDSARGPGIEKGLAILEKVRREIGVPVLSDVHTVDEVDRAARVLDVIQIPAFLCRQTDLLTAAAKTGKPVNVKKGQFLAPEDVSGIVEKIQSAGNDSVIITERGASFGYHNLVVDLRSLVIMRTGLLTVGDGEPGPISPERHPAVVFDATHSVQLPGAQGKSTGGDRRFIPYLALGAAAAGVDGIFMEVHPDPPRALCDATNQFYLKELPELLERLKAVDALTKQWEGKNAGLDGIT
jgi:2-dehydro-3-deoxyphosphooctonate aldolase (KDO 8-P synthase)